MNPKSLVLVVVAVLASTCAGGAIFTVTKPASNPEALVLHVDARKVLGWISGVSDYAGRQVTVRIGDGEQTVMVQRDNTFTWHYRLEARAEAIFRVGDLERRVTLHPPRSQEPSVFFVVDRTVIRPRQKVQFAGFLRRLDRRGEFVPIAGREVEVQCRSSRKSTLAGKLKLRSDEAGRIDGAYTFTEADVLDDYVLSAPGFRGQAIVTLAEFRKSKVKLNISGEVDDAAARLRFEAVDFLDKPVGGSSVRFTAQVVRGLSRPKPGELKTEDFVYHDPESEFAPRLDDFSEEERLLCLASPWLLTMVGGGSGVVAQVQGEVALGDEGGGEHSVPVESTWLDGQCSLVVQGVLTDSNGREQRATKIIRLARGKGNLLVRVPNRVVVAGETVRVRAAIADRENETALETGAVVAMRLEPQTASPYYRWHRYAYQGHAQFQSVQPFRSSARWAPYWQPTQSVGRSMATATALVNGEATLRIPEAGAYKIVVVSQGADGVDRKGEVGIVVHARHYGPGLVLRLDGDRFEAGEALTGTLHSRFDGARVLLTIRDGLGLRYWRPILLAGGSGAFSLRLPRDVRHVCSVDATYVGEGGGVHSAQRLVRVRPSGRLLAIETTVKEVCDPGETVTIGLQVDRKEPVDLVVSVYDQSLLGIAPDRSVDVRSFYLADGRARQAALLDLLRRRLGGITLADIALRARERLKAIAKTGERYPNERNWVSSASNPASVRYFSSQLLTTILNLAGVRTSTHDHRYHGRNWHSRELKWVTAGSRVADLLEVEGQSGWSLHYSLVGDAIVLTEWHPSYTRYPGGQFRRFRGFGARGDSHFSVSANAFHSVSGQSFISHMPGGTAELIDLDAGQAGTVRRDFSDSAFWNARVRTDETGRASVEFKLPDSLTNWQVTVTAVSREGHVGQARSRFRTFKPIMVWPMLPRVFTQGDRVELYASVHNRTDKPQRVRVRLKVENGHIDGAPEAEVTVPPNSNRPVYWTFEPKEAGFTQLLMSAECAAGADASLKRLPVVSTAVEEVAAASSGFCKDVRHIRVPEGVDLTASTLEISFAPSLVADMVDTLDYLVGYPHGCVEQTMSRFLPAIKVAQILRRMGIRHAPLEEKLPKCVAQGIKRLLALQRDDGGWGWQGNGRTHEMMTPYALYGLLQAEKAGYEISSEKAVDRGLARLKSFIDAMGPEQATDRIYCMYVYAHRKPLDKLWWRFIDGQQKAGTLSDYAVGLAAEMAAQQKRPLLAGRLADTLRTRAKRRGGQAHWTTAKFSRWRDDPHEITAVVMKALVAYNPQDELIPEIISYFASTKRGNRWNSTKDTAMILFALCEHLAATKARPGAKPNVVFHLNDGKRRTVSFEGGMTRKLVLPASALRTGRNAITFGPGAEGTLYRLVLRHRVQGRHLAARDDGVQVTRTFWLQGPRRRQLKPGDTVPRGAYIQCTVQGRGADGERMRYVLLASPKPSGCEILPADDRRYRSSAAYSVLREDKTTGVLTHHEEASTSVNSTCYFHAELAGEYVVPPAAVEFMYDSSRGGHSGTFHFTVKDKHVDADSVRVSSR